MSRLSKAVSEVNEKNILRKDETVTNFMGGDSYVMNPLDTLRMIAASSIFAEPQYYRDGGLKDLRFKNMRSYGRCTIDSLFDKSYEDKTSTEIMTGAIDRALDYDFEETLRIAVDLRTRFLMRLNPQIIMVRAAMHPKRKEFSKNHPGDFDMYNQTVMSRGDEPMSQMAYFIYANGSKKNMPSILKRSWSNCLSRLSRPLVAKYKNHEIGMINAVRLCHANSTALNELMTNGTISVDEDTMTWENYISKHGSSRTSWNYVVNNIFTHPCTAKEDHKTGFEYEGRTYYATNHMAILRNLRNMSKNLDYGMMKFVLAALKAGVKSGKQFPFRYYSAIKVFNSAEYGDGIAHIPMIVEALEECIDISVENMPKLDGRTICLSDNSGSAWGSFTSEYGTLTTAEINNLSAVITAARSDEGYVGKFGDTLKVYPINKRNGILRQAKDISNDRGDEVGLSTEGGIWEFFKKAMDTKDHWDNIFIYSDMQAGTGNLYGTRKQHEEYGDDYGASGMYINVYKLVLDYRKKVFNKVNVFSVQTAGYNNSALPDQGYRISLLYGWTGKESQFARAMIDLWNEIESRNKQ